MLEKMKWFGRYLGCNVLDEDGKIQVIKIGCYGDFDKIQLILKNLKDITDEDAIECIYISSGGYLDIKIENKGMYGFRFSSCYESSKRRRNHGYGDRAFGMDQFESKQIDFLRSKGYAIGIPKEYYITESEL